jgi:hypothetical protein
MEVPPQSSGAVSAMDPLNVQRCLAADTRLNIAVLVAFGRAVPRGHGGDP